MWFVSSVMASGVGLSPPYVILDAAPGAVVGKTLTIRNPSARPIEVKAFLEDLWYTDQGHAFGPPGTFDRSAAVFSDLTPRTFRLGAKEVREIELVIRIPNEARGGYYGTVFVEAAISDSATMRMASLIVLGTGGVDAPTIEAGNVDAVVTKEGAKLRVQASQSGQTHSFCRLRGAVRGQDEQLTRADSPEVRFLPGQSRAIELDFGVMAAGVYRFDGVVACQNTAPSSVSTRFSVAD